MASSKLEALNTMPFVGSKDIAGITFPFYIFVKEDDSFLMPDKWDGVKKETVGKAKDYKKGDVVKVVGMELNKANNWQMLITDDSRAIWAEGLKPEKLTFSATIPQSVKEAVSESRHVQKAVVDSKEDAAQVNKALGVKPSAPSWTVVLPVVGLMAGLAYVHKTGKSGWAYLGYAIVGASIFSAPYNYFTLGKENNI